MSKPLKFIVDAKALADVMNGFKAEAEAAIEDGIEKLSIQTHLKILELANSKLNQTRKIYTDALKYEEVSSGVWVVSLEKEGMWIEDGKPAGSMLQDLLRKNAKISKYHPATKKKSSNGTEINIPARGGKRYKVIPFSHGDSKNNTDRTQGLVDSLKADLRKRGVSMKKIEYNPDGSPKLGKLHSFNIDSPHPSAAASHPIFSGVTIYQSKGAKGKIKRDVMTFRVASEEHPEKWIHPGREASNFFEEALKWANNEFDQFILPGIYDKFNKK